MNTYRVISVFITMCMQDYIWLFFTCVCLFVLVVQRL